LTANSDKFSHCALADDAVIGINHPSARMIWAKACLSSNPGVAYLSDLYPHLIAEFKKVTKCESREPSIEQLRQFFLTKNGKQRHDCISANKFDSFFEWFSSMCLLLKDLRHIYTTHTDPLKLFFVTRGQAEDALKAVPHSAFILRVSKTGGLAISWKNAAAKVKHHLLTRVRSDVYADSTDKEMNLFKYIRGYDKLQYFLADQLIRKDIYF